MGKYYGEGGVYGGLGGYMTKWVAVWVFALGGVGGLLFGIVAILANSSEDAAVMIVQGVVGLVVALVIKSIPTREPPRPAPKEEEPPTE